MQSRHYPKVEIMSRKCCFSFQKMVNELIGKNLFITVIVKEVKKL